MKFQTKFIIGLGGVALAVAVGIFLFFDAGRLPGISSEASSQSAFVSSGDTFPQGSVLVEMTQAGFSPEEISVNEGTVVVWVNRDSVARWPASNLHPTHGIYPEFDPLGPVEPGRAWMFTFDKAGTWRFHDHLKPNLRGEVIVTPR